MFDEEFARVVGVKFGNGSRTDRCQFAVILLSGLLADFRCFINAPVDFVVIHLANAFSSLYLFKVIQGGGPKVCNCAISSRSTTKLRSIRAQVFIDRFCRFPSISAHFIAGRKRFINGHGLEITQEILNRLARFYHADVHQIRFALCGNEVGLCNFDNQLKVSTASRPVIVGRFVGHVAQRCAFKAVNCMCFIFRFQALFVGSFDRAFNHGCQ